MIIKEHTRNQKRMYRIHKQEEKIHNLELLVGSQKQEIDRLNNIINELEKELRKIFNKMEKTQVEIEDKGYYYTSLIPLEDLLDKIKELKEEGNKDV